MKKLTAILAICFCVMSCSSEKGDFEKAVQTRTVEDYKRFLEKYPDSKFKEMVLDSIQALELLVASEVNTIEAFEDFMVKYPESKFMDSAKSKMISLEFSVIAEQNTIEAYRQFLEKYPYSKYDDEIKTRLSRLKAELKAKEKLNAALLRSVREKDIVKVRDLIKKGADPNTKDPKNGWSILKIASYRVEGYGEIVKFLLKSGADPNLDGNESPLYWAARGHEIRGKWAMSKALSPLFGDKAEGAGALEKEQADIVKALLEKGSNPNAKGYRGGTPLMWAVAGNYPLTVRILLDNRADPNLTNPEGRTALDMTKEPGIIEMLKKAGAK